MTRLIRACAVACALTIPLAGCNTSGSASYFSALATATGALLRTDAAAVKAAAVTRCRSVEPTASTIKTAIDLAAGTLSPDDIAATLCDGLNIYEAFAADTGQPQARRPRPGSTVTNTVYIAGKPMTAVGKIKK